MQNRVGDAESDVDAPLAPFIRITPGPFENTYPNTGRSLMSNVLLAEALHWTIRAYPR